MPLYRYVGFDVLGYVLCNVGLDRFEDCGCWVVGNGDLHSVSMDLEVQWSVRNAQLERQTNQQRSRPSLHLDIPISFLRSSIHRELHPPAPSSSTFSRSTLHFSSSSLLNHHSPSPSLSASCPPSSPAFPLPPKHSAIKTPAFHK